MTTRLQAVAAAVAACPAEERPWLVDRLWANGFFGRDPFLWAEKSKAVGLDLGEVMLGRHRLVNDIIDRSTAAATLGSIKSPRKAASSRENGKKGGRKSRYIEIDTKGRFSLLVTQPKKEDHVINYRQYGVLAKFDGFSPAMRPVWADARMCFLYDDETPTASQISTAWGLVADVLKYSHDQEYQELTALLK